MLSRRKSEHLDICLTHDVSSLATTGIERFRLVNQPLPEIALRAVDLSTQFMGHALGAPLLISAMTGGASLAREVNLRLAAAAQELQIAMGLGSQRTAIEEPEHMATYQVRQVAPDILLFANLGAVQLNLGYGVDECARIVEGVGADALVLHLNPLQEALQPGGDTNFAGLIDKIAKVCRLLPVPVIVKEVGWGLSAKSAQALQQVGVAALDIAGAGGTSWSRVEEHRCLTPDDVEVARAFADWGNPTAEALLDVRAACPSLPVIASGGIRNGVEAALCLALGADMVGMAIALLRSALESTEAVVNRIEIILRQLRIATWCAGAASVTDLDASRITRRN
ncbi:MAG: type 2 isopentenyl-diphosphate Delta-isomerase [Anaerolineae bacterium]